MKHFRYATQEKTGKINVLPHVKPEKCKVKRQEIKDEEELVNLIIRMAEKENISQVSVSLE